jgi:hypothetical protein
MNRKQFALLLFLLVVVGIAGLLIYNKQNNYSQSGDAAIGKKLLGEFPFNDVAHITLKQGSNELNLVKKDNLWRVRERNDYPANYGEISELLLKARDLKIVQTDTAGPSQLSRYGLIPGTGTNPAIVVDFKDQAEKPIRSLIVGKKHMQKSNRPSPYGEMGDGGFADGRYVKVGTSDTVNLISDPLDKAETGPEKWLNKDFFKVEKARSVSVTFPVETNSWKLSRETETGEWKLADAKPGEQLDTSKISGLANPLNSPTFEDVDTTSKPEQLGLDKPTLVTIETFDNFTYGFKVGQKTNNNYAMTMTVSAALPKERTPGKDEKPEDKAKLDKEFQEKQKKFEDKLAQEKAYEKWTYLVSSWTLEQVLKERGQLMAEKKEEPKKEDKPAAAVPPQPFQQPASLPGTSPDSTTPH